MQTHPKETGNSEHARRLFADQVHKLYEHIIIGTAATLVNSAILAFVFRAHVSTSYLLIWLVCMGGVSACRLIVNSRYQASDDRSNQAQHWYIRFMATLFFSGITWGAAAVFLFPSESVGHQVFLAFVSGGMVAGAVGAFSAIRPAFFIFSLPALLPICIRFFLIGDELHIAMGSMTLLFFILISLAANRMHKNTLALLSLKYEREALVTHLQQEVEQRKAAQDHLRRQKETIEEIVEQRTAQLHKANQRLRAILNYAPLVIWAVDRDAMLTFVDGKGMVSFGFDAAEALHQPLVEMAARNPALIEITERVLEGKFIAETVQVQDVHFVVRCQPMLDADDRVVGAIGVAIDVTELQTAKEALRKSEEKYRELVENINDVLFTVDSRSRIAYISPVIERVLGYGVDELVGKTFFDYVFRDDVMRLKSDFDRALKRSGAPKEYRFVSKSGAIKWCRVNARPFSEKSVNAGVHGVLVDITWSKRLEEQLQRSQKMEALGVMAGGVAHELNNILSGILSYPELLLMDLPRNSPFRKPLETIKASGESASAVVQDLLALSRKGVYSNEVLNLRALVEQCLGEADVRSLFDRFPAIEVQISLASDLLNIKGSSIQIIKSLQCLITNAVEAMPKGGRLKIAAYNQYMDQRVAAFDTIKEGEYAVLSVSDSGVGIQERDQTRIFEPFYSKKIFGRRGSGLGMAVVWGTIKDHGGYIDLVSNDGSGTRFDLYFPASRELVMTAEHTSDISDICGGGETILIVDDMPTQREIASHLLTKLGYRCKTVPSGEQAVEFLREHAVDLVILDMIMEPGIDGYETYRRIKAVRPEQKAIIASGYSETERVKQTLALGAGCYIKKPYTISAIGKCIKEELNPH